MDVIVVRKNKKEVGRLVPSKRTLLIGRSPVCDMVLRSGEMRPLHFLIEWIGDGDFKPNEGFWSLVDISKSNDQGKGFSGEAAIIQKNPIEIEGFEFVMIQDDLAETAVSKGVIARSMDFEADKQKTVSSGQSLVIELITYDRRNDVITNVNHFNRELLSRGLRINNLPHVSFALSATQNNTLLVENAGESALTDVFNRTEKITGDFKGVGKKLDIVPGDFHSFITQDTAYYVRWVPQVEFIPPPRAWSRDPAILTLLGMFFFIGTTAVLMSQVELPKVEEIPEPKRVARVEVQETAPPPPKELPTPPPAKKEPEPEKEPVVMKQADAVEKVKKPEVMKTAETPKPVAPKGDQKLSAIKNTDQKKQQAGLEQKAPVTDVNTVGLLGKLKGGSKSNARVSADELINKSRPTDSAVSDTGSVTLSQAPLGQIGAHKDKGSSSKNEGPGLAAASTTLKANKAAEGPSVGGLVGPKGKGKFGGEGLSGVSSGSAGMGLDTKSMEVSGGLTKDDIRDALRENRRSIRNCYERGLLAKKDLEGRLVLRWKISPPGSVETISIQNSNMGTPSLENCVLDIVKKIQFPQSPNKMPTIVIYPFVFQGKN